MIFNKKNKRIRSKRAKNYSNKNGLSKEACREIGLRMNRIKQTEKKDFRRKCRMDMFVSVNRDEISYNIVYFKFHNTVKIHQV